MPFDPNKKYEDVIEKPGFDPTAPYQDLEDTESPDLTRTGLQKFGDVTEEVLTTPSSVGPSISQATTIPERIGRGTTVGINKLLENTGIVPSPIGASGITDPSQIGQLIENIPGAVRRGLEAFQPGFQPAEGEGVASGIGEAVGSLPMAVALTPTIAGAPAMASATAKAARLGVQVLAGAAGGGAFQTLHDASEKGDIDPVDVAYAAGINGAFPIVRFGTNVIKKFLKAAVELPTSTVSSLSREAMGELADDPAMLEKYAGTAEAINRKTENIQRKMVNQLSKTGDRLKAARLKFGITSPLETPIEQVAEEGLPQKDFKQIVKDFVDLKTGERIPESSISDIFGVSGKTPKAQAIPIKQRIKELYELRYQIDQNNVVKRKVGAEVQPISGQDIEDKYLRNLRSQINEKLDELTSKVKDGGSLRLMDKAYSETRKLYDEFIKKLSDPARAEQTLMSIYKKGDADEIVGLGKDTVKVLRSLERRTGEKFIDPLRKEFGAREFRNIKGKGGSGIINLATAPFGALLETAGPIGVSTALNTFNGLGSAIQRLGEIAASRAGRATTLSLTPPLLRGENK